jgi:predicted DNA-binding ribbon-helix-helix protein
MSDERADTNSKLRKRSVRIAGHATSISLEDPFWLALQRIARRQGRSVNELIAEIDNGRSGGLSGAIRLFVLAELERQAGELVRDA